MAKHPYEYIKREQHWQQQWYENKIYQATKQTGKKFFLHFAYPGVSGFLHVGHMRGFTYCDIIARYKRMTGYDVLFPAGFHASGIPSVGFAKKVERHDPDTIKLLQDHGLSQKDIEKLTDPEHVVDYFSKVYVEDYWKRFGFLIDYTRLMTTISPGYKQFITWQFHKLHEKHLLIQKPHYAPFCPQCGPVAVDKSETDVSKGGAAEVLEFTIIKFTLPDGTILPAATLRPETIFGVTNMWVNPNVTYEKVCVGKETWICSHECVEKLSYQLDNIHVTNEKIKGKDLVGKTCKVPIDGREIPILPGIFADPSIATGVVMSVPAHAPYDWIALQEANTDIEPITIIDVKGFTTYPAKQLCDTLHITNQKETQKLDQATEEVYKKEFHTGVLNSRCGQYAGIKVSEIKDQVKNDLLNENKAELIREFSEQVICRCGAHVLIKQIPDQWFIQYSNPTLTKQTIDHVQTMHIYPGEYKEELPRVLEWFDDRAVIRKGSWLGTEFPFKPGWIIEPISDSTLYPAYYCIAPFVNTDQIKPEELTVEFFDYVFLGKGKPKTPLWDTIKKEVDYWYPVDINLGGKEHKTVHFPVFIMNHVAVMPPSLYPQGLFVHWWVTQKGKEKISKSKGGAEPIPHAATTYGVDAMRFYYAHIGSPFVDVEWDPDVVLTYKQRILSLYTMVQNLQACRGNKDEHLDAWLKSTLHRHIAAVHKAFDQFDLRVAANELFFEFPRDLQWYVKRGGGNDELLKHVLTTWIRLITPFTPHLAEELWHMMKQESFVSTASYPTFDESLISENDEVGEYLLSKVIDDVNEITKVTGMKPKDVYLYVAPEWKTKVLLTALSLYENGELSMGVLMKQVLSDEHLKKKSTQISKYAGSLVGEIKKFNPADRRRYQVALNEQTYLLSAETFLQKELGVKVHVYDTDDEQRIDPENKARFAVPLRPAIYLV